MNGAAYLHSLLYGRELRIAPMLEPGQMRGYYLDGPLWVRHMADLTPAIRNARCDFTRGTCPTWTDEECRCMVDPT